jgi:hypothetical protein
MEVDNRMVRIRKISFYLIQLRNAPFIRKWRLKHRSVADSLEEPGDRLCTFSRLPPT